jgi:Uma2 family endonuclease
VASVSSQAVSSERGDDDQRIVIYGMSFARYVALRELLEDRGLRVSFLEGALEIVSPSHEHERRKKTIARLLELYALERGVELYPYGSATYRLEGKERGIEPDECYFVGGDLDPVARPFPDLAIEVVVSSGGLDKLDIYDGLGVREVWVFSSTDHAVFVREPQGGYRRSRESALLPDLDVDRVAELAAGPDHAAAVHAFRASLRP